VIGERPHVDLCRSAHSKSSKRSGSCARRVQRRPPDGSAKCFGCLLVGCRRAATPADPFLVSRHARARSRPRGHIEQCETAGHCERTCCSFALSRAIRLLIIARGGAGTCSMSFGSSRAAFWVSRSRHLGSLSRVPSGAKSHPPGTVSGSVAVLRCPAPSGCSPLLVAVQVRAVEALVCLARPTTARDLVFGFAHAVLRCVGCSAAKRPSFEASGRRVGQGGLELSLVGRTSLLRPFLASRCRRSTRTWSLEAA
jgi:hypothetical protein